MEIPVSDKTEMINMKPVSNSCKEILEKGKNKVVEKFESKLHESFPSFRTSIFAAYLKFDVFGQYIFICIYIHIYSCRKIGSSLFLNNVAFLPRVINNVVHRSFPTQMFSMRISLLLNVEQT